MADEYEAITFRGARFVPDETVRPNTIRLDNITRSTNPFWRAAEQTGQTRELSREMIEQFLAEQQRYIDPRPARPNWDDIEALYKKLPGKPEPIHPLLRVSEGL